MKCDASIVVVRRHLYDEMVCVNKTLTFVIQYIINLFHVELFKSGGGSLPIPNFMLFSSYPMIVSLEHP